MQPDLLSPKQSLNKAYLKAKVTRASMELFKQQLIALLDKSHEKFSEDTLKDFVGDFLKAVYCNNRHFISINKERKDLSIHTGKSISNPVAVIMEVKRINSGEMVTAGKLNTKAFHELVLYYFHEVLALKNPTIYPGPGIWQSDGKNVYVTAGFRL